MYSLIFKPRAILMTKESYDHYEIQKNGLGEEFLAELDGIYHKIERHPEYFGRIKKNYRQAALKRFPFVIIFEVIKTEVVIFSVFHTSRNPRYKFKD